MCASGEEFVAAEEELQGIPMACRANPGNFGVFPLPKGDVEWYNMLSENFPVRRRNMNHKQIYTILLLPSAAMAAVARFFFLSLGLDHQGLPITNHPTAYLLIAVSIIFPLGYLALALKCPCREKAFSIWLRPRPSVPAIVGGAMVLLGATGELLFSGAATTGNMILCVLGVVSGLCLILSHLFRVTGNRKNPPTELVPVVYLVVKLILNFKNWSVDPVILDYFPMLMALIFSLLSLYGGAGFLFDEGKPRKTLCYGSLCVFFSAMAAVDGFLAGDPGIAMTYLGFLLWNLPVVFRLLEEEPERTDNS